MKADIRAGTFDMNTANKTLKEEVKAIKGVAESLLCLMDVSAKKITFEQGEIDIWIRLRQALLDFRKLDVSPNVARTIMISPKNMDKLQDVYGAIELADIDKVINDLIAAAESPTDNKEK